MGDLSGQHVMNQFHAQESLSAQSHKRVMLFLRTSLKTDVACVVLQGDNQSEAS